MTNTIKQLIFITLMLCLFTVTCSANENYTYLEDYETNKFLSCIHLMLKGETSYLYGISTFSESQPINQVNYSNIIMPINKTINNQKIIWNNSTHKIVVSSHHRKQLLDKNGLPITEYKHSIYIDNGYLIAGNGSNRQLYNQYGKIINDIHFGNTDSKSHFNMFGMRIVHTRYIGPDRNNPGKFTIVTTEKNEWFN